MITITNGTDPVEFLLAEDKIIDYLLQVNIAGHLKNFQPISLKNIQLQIPVVLEDNFIRVMVLLQRYGVVCKRGENYYVTALGHKIKDHIFRFLLKDKPLKKRFIPAHAPEVGAGLAHLVLPFQ